jgi:hypothetical protein
MDIGDAAGFVFEVAVQALFEGPRWARWGCGVTLLAIVVALMAWLVWAQI